MISFFNGDYVAKEDIVISPDDRGFLFSDGIYEVIRSYHGRLFKAPEHIRRLNYGAEELRFNTSNFDHLINVAGELINKNQLCTGDATVYIQITRGVAPRSHRFPPSETSLTIYVTARSFTPFKDELENGIHAILVPDQRWARCDIKSIALLPNTLAHQQALEKNASEAIFVREGCVMEGTHSNLAVILDGMVVTPQKTNFILGGITRQVLLDLCKGLSIPSSERPIPVSEISQAEELMIVGTTVEITPIVAINREKVGSGVPGPITRSLQKAFREVVDPESDAD